jgi:tetratricopeptide (TPR) repeat protein
MSLRSKTKRRLFILIGLLLLVGAGLFWVIRGPRVRDAARAAEVRKAGMELYARGDHAAAMPKLSDYLALVKIGQTQPTEAELEALFAFGDCRRRFPLPRREHLREASDRLQLYLEHRPANVAAQRLQAELLTRLDRPADATLAAERVLAQDPTDRDALYYRAAGLYRRPRPDLPAVQKAVDDLLARDPGNVRGLLLSLRVKLDAAAPPAEVIEQAERQAAEHPNDARYELAVGWLYHALANGPVAKQDPNQRVAWEKQMHAWLRKAASRPPTDPVVAEQVAEAMDRAYLFAETIAYMRTAVDKLTAGDEELERALIRRLWQNGGYAEVVDRTAKLNPRDARATWTCWRTGRCRCRRRPAGRRPARPAPG